MEVTDKDIRHFRKFLKENNLYMDYLNCLVGQKYYKLHNDVGLMPNLKKLMERSTHEEFGVMCFTFDAFTWVRGGRDFPREFTQKWCTVCLKWGLYCYEHFLKMCEDKRFLELIIYWNSNGWIVYDMLSESEKKLIENLKNKVRVNYGDLY